MARSSTSMATGTLYEPVASRAPATTEALAAYSAGYAFEVTAISGFTAASQSGSGVGYTFNLRGGCTAPGTGCSSLSGATFNIEGTSTNTTGSATGLTNNIAAGTWIDWQSVPVSSPATQTTASLSIGGYIAP